MLALIEANRTIRRPKGPARRTIVPTSVRVEAGWNRTVPAAATINRLKIEDWPLGANEANVAARLRGEHGVSVADAHMGVTVAAHNGQDIAIVTSDLGDMRKVAEDTPVTIVAI